jgi:hypothetical protein
MPLPSLLPENTSKSSALASVVGEGAGIGPKNWQVAGSDTGAERTAVIYSLVATCRVCHIDPTSVMFVTALAPTRPAELRN